jgi:hypothetical protein
MTEQCYAIDYRRKKYKDVVNKIGWYHPGCANPVIGYVESIILNPYMPDDEPNLQPVCAEHAMQYKVFASEEEYKVYKVKARL